MNGNDNNAVVAVTNAPKTNQRKKQKKAKKTDGLTAVRTGPSVTSGPANSELPSQQFKFVISSDEKTLFKYMGGVFDPWNNYPRVPARVGGFELNTRVWKTYNSGVAYADGTGNAFVAVAAPNWVESGNADGVPDTRSQLLAWGAGPHGSCAYASSSSTVATQFPTLTQDIDGGWQALPTDNPTDYNLNATSRIRLTAMGLKIRQTMAADVASGEAMLVGTANPLGGTSGGDINGSTWDLLEKTNPEVLTRATRQIPGWGADEVFSIVAIPAEQQAFEMCQLPNIAAVGIASAGAGTAQRKFPIFHLGAVFRGMPAGQKISFDVVYCWETEVAKTNSGDVVQPKSSAMPQATLDAATSNMRPYATSAHIPGIHTLPFIETMAASKPEMVMALGTHPKLHPVLKPVTIPKGPLVDVDHNGGFFSKLKGVAGDIFKKAADSNAIKAIPYVGGVINSVSSILSDLFN